MALNELQNIWENNHPCLLNNFFVYSNNSKLSSRNDHVRKTASSQQFMQREFLERLKVFTKVVWGCKRWSHGLPRPLLLTHKELLDLCGSDINSLREKVEIWGFNMGNWWQLAFFSFMLPYKILRCMFSIFNPLETQLQNIVVFQ